MLIVEDDGAFAQRVVRPHFARHWNVALAHNVPQALSALDAATALELVLVDLDIPGSSGFDADPPGGGFPVIERAAELHPDALVVALTAHVTPRLVNEAQRRGAEYMVKHDVDDNLRELALRLRSRQPGASTSASQFVDELSRAHGLTARQSEVVALALRGLRQRDMAEHLEISPNTLKSHVDTILERCGVRSLSELTREFWRRTLGEP